MNKYRPPTSSTMLIIPSKEYPNFRYQIDSTNFMRGLGSSEPFHLVQDCWLSTYSYLLKKFLHIADVFQNGFWEEVKSLADPKLKNLSN